MRKRLAIVVATGLVAVGFLGACGDPEPVSAPPSAAASTSVVAATPAAKPTVPAADLKKWVDAAQLSPSVIGAARPDFDQFGVYRMVEICDRGMPSDYGLAYSRIAAWSGTKIKYVEHNVFGYADVAGADVVTQARDRAHSCTSYQIAEADSTQQRNFKADYAFATPAGIDAAYGWCETSTVLTPVKSKGEMTSICNAVLARGHVVATVRVFAEDATRSMAGAQRILDTCIAVVAPALVKAAPAGQAS